MRFLVLALLALPLPAFALSCLQHGVTDAYHQAADAKEGYEAGVPPGLQTSAWLQEYAEGCNIEICKYGHA